MASFDVSIDIQCPPIDVYDAFVDLTQHALDWDTKLQSIQRGGGPFGVGVSFRTVRKVKGRTHEGEIRVLGKEPFEWIEWEYTEGDLLVTYSTQFKRVEGGSRLTVSGKVKGNPIAAASMKRYWQKQALAIKAEMEAP